MSEKTFEQIQEEIAALEKKKSAALKNEVMQKVDETIKAAQEAQKTIETVVQTAKTTVAAEVNETKRVLESAKADVSKVLKADINQIDTKLAVLQKTVNEIVTKLQKAAESLK